MSCVHNVMICHLVDWLEIEDLTETEPQHEVQGKIGKGAEIKKSL